MANTYKAYELAKQLQWKLAIRIGTKVKELAFDSDGNPYIMINDGTPATTEANAIVKVAPESWPLAKDSLGNTALAYTPHVVQLVTEAPAAGSGPGVYLTCQLFSDILAECFMLGCKFEWYQSDNTDTPDLDDITAAKLKASIRPDVYNQLTSQQ